MMRKKDGGKMKRKTTTVGCRALPVFHSAAQNNHKPSTSLSIYLSIRVKKNKKKTEEWRRKKDGEGGRSAAKRKSEAVV